MKKKKLFGKYYFKNNFRDSRFSVLKNRKPKQILKTSKRKSFNQTTFFFKKKLKTVFENCNQTGP